MMFEIVYNSIHRPWQPNQLQSHSGAEAMFDLVQKFRTAKTQELCSLSKPCKPVDNKSFTSHLRHEADLIEASSEVRHE